MDEIEAYVLAGGAGRRMGGPKAEMVVGGEPLAVRPARALREAGYPVTLVGGRPLDDFAFLPDETPFGGPLRAIAQIRPVKESAFVCACDLPCFDARVVGVLADAMRADAAIPFVGGRAQPLAGLYVRGAFDTARDCVARGERAVMEWVNRLSVAPVSEEELRAAGIDPESVLGVNTPEELARRILGPS